MCGDFYLSYPAVGRTLEVILTPDNDCVYCTAISLVFTTLINMSPKQIPLHLLHLWINAIQMVTLFTFTAFNILDIHDKACSRSSTLTFTTRVCVFPHTPLQPSTWNTGRCIKRFNQSPLKKNFHFPRISVHGVAYEDISYSAHTWLSMWAQMVIEMTNFTKLRIQRQQYIICALSNTH